MRILLLGEFSGFYKNLKQGLIELGHEVNLVNPGDAYRHTTKSDLYIPRSSNSFIRGLEKLVFPFWALKKYYYYDVIQLTGHNIFGGLKYKYNYFILKKIANKSNKIFMSACGSDYYYYKQLDKMDYNAIEQHVKIDLMGNNPYLQSSLIENNKKVVQLVDGVIPVTYPYSEAYKETNKLLATIPFPINVEEIEFIPQDFINNKITIFHGITREGFKGTSYIRDAMERIKEKYPNDVEIVIDGKMPLEKYLEILKRANIVIDQALAYSYGMNAMYSMAMGKVVLSGNSKQCQEEYGRNDIPIIHIKPSAEDIYIKLEKLILNKNNIVKTGKKSRLFVEDFHHHVKVAQQYIETWNSIKENKLK